MSLSMISSSRTHAPLCHGPVLSVYLDSTPTISDSLLGIIPNPGKGVNGGMPLAGHGKSPRWEYDP